MIGLLLLLLVGLVPSVTLMTVLMMHRLTHPPRKTYAWAVSRSKPGTPMELPSARAFEAVLLKLGGRELPGWRIVGDDPRGPLVVHTPGWGDSRLGVLPRLEGFLARASAVLTWDPPGLGDAEGTCDLGVSEPRLLAELVEREIEGDPSLVDRGIVLFGSSLGGSVSIVTAASRDVAPATAFHARLSERARAAIRGVLAEAPYRLAPTPAHNVMELSGLPHRVNGALAFWLLGLTRGGPAWRGFDRALHAANLGCPLLVVHPELDEVSPLEDGQAIAAAVPGGRGRLAVIAGGSHNTLWTDEATRGETVRAVRGFFDEISRA
jgi:pimeloyl-ACP methyl ester carboxylesterase